MKTAKLGLPGFICYVLATILLTTMGAPAQTNTNCTLVMNCPSNIVVTSCFNVQEFYNPTASNICCGVLYTNVACTPPSGSIFAVGTTTTVTCMATDCDLNTNYCTFTVTVQLDTNCTTNCLQIQCPSNLVVASCTNLPVYYAPTVTDPCCGSNWTLVCTPPSGSFFAPNTTNLVDCFVTDYCGLSNSCSFTLIVLPDTNNCPTNCITLTCPSNIVVTTCSSCATVFYSVTATNSCCFSNVTLNYNPPSGTCFPLGTNTVQVTAYDPDCASTPPTNCSFTVTVLPCPPNCLQVQCPSNKTVPCDSNWTFDVPTATSCCTTNVAGLATNVLITSSASSIVTNGVCPLVYVTETWLITDGCGDSTNCSQTVTVEGCCTNGTIPCGCTNGSSCTLALQSFTNVYSFTNGSDGANPFFGQLVLSGNTLYGTAAFGGSSGHGTVFKVNTDGTGFQTLYAFAGYPTDGEYPWGGLVLSGNILYGTTDAGGGSGGGTVFSIQTGGSGYAMLYNFGSGGYEPYGDLILSGSTLYGTTSQGGTSGWGTVYTVQTSGSGYATLHNFTSGSDGSTPYDNNLVLSGGTLYGTTANGAIGGNGTVFSVQTSGSGFTTLQSFDFTNGGNPIGGLVLSSNTLYGTTDGGGTFGAGTVFSVSTSGTGYTVLHSFSGSEGYRPYCALVLSGNTLFGTTTTGGSFGAGTVFAVQTDGSCFTTLYDFTGGSDGASPWTGLVISGNTLYGTAETGGISNYGTVFALTFTNLVTNCLQIECPSNIVVTNCTNIQEFYTPTVTDLACTNWTVVCTPPSGSYFAAGTVTTVDCTATDCCSNSASCSFTVTVVQDTNCCLQVQCPTNKTVPCDSAWTFDEPTATSCCTTVIQTSTGVTNVLITPTSTVTNGVCPQQVTVTQSWLITDGCGDTNTCSQMVTVECCPTTNCLNLVCPSNIVVTTCSNCVPVFYSAAAYACCTNISALIYNPPSGTCFNLGTSNVTVTAYACGFITNCEFTVTVNPDTNCCSNTCCGPDLGAQTINWLDLPTNGPVNSDPFGSNTNGTWIITNLPCYGNVLVTQNCPDEVLWFLNPDMVNVANGYGSFQDVETGYGPYSWGTGGWLDLLNNSTAIINYTVNFYFLDGPPNPCTLYLGVTGLGADTTATASQPVTFRAEYDLNSPLSDGTASAQTTLDGIYGASLIPGVSGTIVGSAYNLDGYGDDRNTGWAVLQPTNNLLTTNLPAGSGTDINGNSYPASGTYPCLTLAVTQEPGDGIGFTVGYVCCANASLQVQCPTNKTEQCCSNWTFDVPTATTCCTNYITGSTTLTNLLITSTGFVTNGVCPTVAITQTWLITDGCGDSNTCSQTVTVLGCCTNECCGPDLGPQTIQWLQYPATNAPALLPDPSGGNTNGTWIITNLPCYGNVLVTQTFPDPPSLIYWFLNQNLDNVPKAYGSFQDLQAGYGAYSWGTYGSLLDFYNGNSSPISYNLNFYFLDGPPNPCTLYLGVVGLAEDTTATVSQPVTFRVEYDLTANAPGGNGYASADTTLDGLYGGSVPGTSGTLVGSAYSLNGVGDPANTGWAVLQPTNNLATTSLPAGSGTDINGNSYPASGTYPCLSLAVTQEPGDGIAFTVGYVCCNPCPTNCLQVQCPTNKTVACDSAWAFDPPTATSCCTNEYDGSPTSPATNVLILPITTVTNGVCPQQVTITQTWMITDLCGDSNTCSQVVTVECCPTNCIDLTCPSNIVVTTCSNCAPVFYSATGTACCTNVLTLVYNPPSGTCFGIGTSNVTVTAYACGFITNCEFTVTVNACTNCLHVECPTNKTEQCGSMWAFDQPTATSCCPTDFSGTTTNVLITSISTVTNGVCPQIITNTWLITDACGESNTCSQVVTVVDTTPPMIHCPTNAVVVALNTNCQLVIPSISVSATDNCTPVCDLVYSQSPPAGTVVPGPDAYVTVTVTDLCGNSSSCVVEVEGMDRTGPVVTCPASLSVTNCLVPCVPVTATDNCCPQSSLIYSQSPPCGTPIGPGINSVTVTVTDCHGNSTSKVVHLIIGGSESFLGNLYNTGNSSSSDSAPALLADDTVDPHYSLPAAAVPAGMPADYFADAVAVSDVCHATGTGCAWLNTYVSYTCYEYVPWNLPPDPAHTTAASKWIAPDYTNNGCCPGGNYTYTLNFVLPAGFNQATATISGRWAADNAASMKLNGRTVPLATPGFGSWTSFTIPPGSGFVTGANSLAFIVDNYGDWTGLRVEFTNAYANCSTCAPPVISSITPSQSLQAGSTATFNVTAGGTPPLSYQWFHNNVNLAGDTNSTLQLHSISYSDAGLYSVVISNPCGVVTGYVRLTVTQPWWWQWGWWNVQVVTNPLAATVGPDLNLVGSDFATNYGIAAGTTEDFGLPGQGGQIVNVMDINPQAAASIEVPLIASTDSSSDTNYTLIMDIYEPDTSLGTPSTLYQSIACCVSNLGSSGQDGVALTLDETNKLHITGSAGGVPFDVASAEPLPVDAWNRVALVVDNPQDGSAVTLGGYINGQNVIHINPCICCIIHFTASTINWGVSPPIVLSTPANAVAPNGEFYVSSIQFHDIALSPEAIAGIGSPDIGPAPANKIWAGPSPVLSATTFNGAVNITWSGSPYELQETTDLSSGVWVNSALPFTEGTDTTGSIVTTAVVTPAPNPPAKFYRLVFSP
ncbi:MAG: choice-of-anchor tandem repeat GloVer-containing protein [Limisphaerales bacterium]